MACDTTLTSILYQGATTQVFRNFLLMDDGFSGNPIIFRDLTFEFDQHSYIVAFDCLKRDKDDGVNTTNFGFPGPTAVASAVAATAQTKTIDAFEYATNGAIQAAWPTTNATITTTNVAPAVGTYAGNIAVIASTTGYATRTVALNLAQFSTPGDSDDSDYIVFWLKIDVPASLVEIRLEFDVDPSTNDFAHNYYWKSVQSAQIQPAVNQTVTAQTIRDQLITQASFADPSTLNDIDEQVNQLLAQYLESGVNQWTQLSVKKSEFTRVGSSSNTWANVAKVRVQVQTNAGGTVNVGVDSFYMQGGVDANLVGDYDWIYQFENPITHTRSPFFDAMAAQVTLDKTKATVTVQNPTDQQATYIRLYRRGGDNPEDYLLSVRQIVTEWTGNTTIVDGVPDSDLGEVADFDTGSDLIELSNASTTEIEPTVCEVHQQRLWINDTNYRDRLWYSDRGNSEQFREDQYILSKSGPGDPIVRPFALDDQMFIFTAKTIKRVNGSSKESFEALETGSEVGLFSTYAICKGDNRIFFRTYDGIYALPGGGFPTKVSGDIDNIFHGILLDNQTNLVAIDPAYSVQERLEFFDSLLHFSYTGTDGNRYEMVRDFETERWEQTDLGPTSYLRLDDTGDIYAGDEDGFVYQMYEGQTDNGDPISIDWTTKYIDVGYPDREKFITSIVVDCELNGASIDAYLDLNNGEDTVTQPITCTGRTSVQFPMTQEIRCRNWAFRVTGNNAGVRMLFYKVTFYYELAPPLTLRTDSYELDFNWTRWKFIRRLWIAGRANGTVTLALYLDGVLTYTTTFTLPATQGWVKAEIKLPPRLKAMLYRFICTSTDEFQVFWDQSDCEWHALNGERGYERARLVPSTR